MRKLLFIPLFICIMGQLHAQGTTGNITGRVLDDITKEGIELAGIRLLNAKDSSYVSGVATDKDGKFTIGAKRGKYIVQISFIGYNTQNLDVDLQRNVALGDIVMKEDGILLGEAVITAKAPEIIVKGDTVEYNADSYRVQEGAVLEDLIKRIPGAEIDSEGKITVNGKDISKILVDGKEFFSDDPKTASQNLPAKMVEKLQVLDKKSDMAQLTGFDDGEEETVINLVVKPEMKEGLMSNVLVGYGNKDRYEGNGFINYAKKDTRVTVLGNINNTNNENANVRGPGRGGVLASKEIGMNIASEPSPKLKYDADISYNYTDNDLVSTNSTEYIGVERSENSMSNRTTKNGNFRTRGRLEWKPDSLTTLIFRPNISYAKNDVFTFGNSSRSEVANPANNFNTDEHSSSKRNTLSMNGNLLLNRKLNDRGRSISLEVSGGFSDGDTDGDTYSLTDYVNFLDSTKLQDQIYKQQNNSYNWRARISYLEPVWSNADRTKMNFLEVAYNIRGNHSETDKKTYDYNDATKEYTTLAEDYTRNTVNDFINQNISLSFQARRQKYNYTVGAELQPSSTKTKVEQPNLETRDLPRRNYTNFAPRLEFNYLWDRRHNLRIRYDGRTEQATTDQLFDGIISQNALDTVRGNPDLRPSFNHNLHVRYQKYIPENASSIMFFSRFTYTQNGIIQVTTWKGNSRNSTYQNIDGDISGFFRLMYNRPLRNKKFSINAATFGNYNKQNTYVSTREMPDPQKNVGNTFRIGENLRLKFNSDVFQFDVGANLTYENTTYSMLKDRNAKIYDYGGFGSFTWYMPYDFALESDLNYSSNSGYESGYQQNTWLWNASLSKQLFKAKNATIRIKVYDILKERTSVSRTSTGEYIRYTTNNTIGSYFMVNFIYRFNSFKGGMKSSDMQEERRGPGSGGPPGGGGRRPF